MLWQLATSHAVLGLALLAPHQAAAHPPSKMGAVIAVQRLPANRTKLLTKIQGSYYHADKLPGLDCDMSVDWPASLSSAKLTVPPARMQALQALKVHVRALRGKQPDIAFDWTEVRIATADQVEAGMRQSIDSFFQMYWSMLASPIISSADQISKIEPQPDGSAKIIAAGPNSHTVISVGRNGVPTQYTFRTPVLSGTISPHYIPSPHPVAGDLRRISSVDVDDQIGVSSMKVSVSLTYQPVSTFFVPRRVTFDVVGAYALTMNYSSCSVWSDTVTGE